MPPSSPARPWWRRVGKWLAYSAAVAVTGLVLAIWLRPIATEVVIERMHLRMAGFTAVDLTGAPGPVRVFARGSGPATILLHDVNDDASAWTAVVPAIDPRRHLMIPDLPGHGASAPAAGPLTLGDLASGVDRVARAASADAPLSLVGNGIGGWLALSYAIAHPGRVSHVIVINGGVPGVDQLKRFLLPHSREEARTAMSLLRSPASTMWPDFVLDDLARQTDDSPLSRLVADPRLAAPALDGLERLEARVTIIWGRDDRVLPAAMAEALRARLPRATLVWIDACGHVPMRECPSVLAPALASALGRVP